ncbi:hypothetical protein BOX15_Mlig009935g1 [Macrostomum lignano]|uniref:Uncharacterized protein n=1 Tax=Macrostomum lignano TaxID=282301 RepID=A0A267EZV8_9PLAT|nr:hypothetical protein BOX15_Mlig009935g1 [Macrostomum lignano]
MLTVKWSLALVIFCSIFAGGSSMKCLTFYLKGVLKHGKIRSRECHGSVNKCFLVVAKTIGRDDENSYFNMADRYKGIENYDVIPLVYMEYNGGCGKCQSGRRKQSGFKCQECASDDCNAPVLIRSFRPYPYHPKTRKTRSSTCRLEVMMKNFFLARILIELAFLFLNSGCFCFTYERMIKIILIYLSLF